MIPHRPPTPDVQPMFQPGFRWSIAALIWCAGIALTLGGVAPEPGVAAPPDASGPTPPLARYAPADAGLFIEIDNLLQIGNRLQQRDLWGIVEPLIGDTQGGWAKALADSLGVESTISMARMFREQVALAAPDWQRLGEGVVVFTQSNPRVLASIVGDRRAKPMLTNGPVRIYRTRTGLWLAMHQSTVILAQSRGAGSFFDRSVALLAGESDEALHATEPFRKQFRNLPAPRLACAYWRFSKNETPPPPLATGWWPRLDHGALVVLDNPEAFEIILRSAETGTADMVYRPRVLLDRLSQLPQTTLAAWATSIDARALFAALRETQLPRLQDLARLLGEQADAELFEAEVISRLGPRCQVCLGADLGAAILDPQFAVLIESVDAGGVTEALRRLAEKLAAASGGEKRAAAFSVETEEHLGVKIHQLRWTRRKEPDGETLGALVTESMAPCCAAHDDWVLISTSPSQLREIIEARIGITNRLEPSIQLAAQDAQLRKAIGVVVLQPSLMQGMFRYWGSVLDQRRRLRLAAIRLGAAWDPEPLAGQVRILGVDSNGLSAGLLHPGDAVVACANTMVAMTDASADLRQQVADVPLDRPVLLRVLREGRMVEITLPPLPPQPPPDATGLEAIASRFAPFEALVSQASAATFSVDRDSGDGYQARAWLRLNTAPADAPSGAPPE